MIEVQGRLDGRQEADMGNDFGIGGNRPPVRIPPPPPPQPRTQVAPLPCNTGLRSARTGELPMIPDAAPRSQQQLDPALKGPESDEAFLKRVYQEELGREPDQAGFDAWMNNIKNGMSRDELRQHFQDCPEAKSPECAQRKAWIQSQAGAEGKDPVETIKLDPRDAGAVIDTSSLDKAVESAANWVFEHYPELKAKSVKADEAGNKSQAHALEYELAGHVIGILRANGIDAQRLARHTQHDMGNPNRYVNDALVLPDGRAIDWWRGDGAAQFHDLDVPSPKTDRNFGVVPFDGHSSSSTLGV